MLKLKPGVTVAAAATQLNAAIAAAGLNVRIFTWQRMLAEIVDIANITQSALFLFVLFVFFVAIIIIMNTLSMAALERTGEIAMMRAVGAQKSFVRGLFLLETLQLGLIFGGAGIVVGIIVTMVLNVLQIPVGSNEMLAIHV